MLIKYNYHIIHNILFLPLITTYIKPCITFFNIYVMIKYFVLKKPNNAKKFNI